MFAPPIVGNVPALLQVARSLREKRLNCFERVLKLLDRTVNAIRELAPAFPAITLSLSAFTVALDFRQLPAEAPSIFLEQSQLLRRNTQ
jgi:hypothetical protein